MRIVGDYREFILGNCRSGKANRAITVPEISADSVIDGAMNGSHQQWASTALAGSSPPLFAPVPPRGQPEAGGVLMSGGERDPETQLRLGGFREGLQKLGGRRQSSHRLSLGRGKHRANAHLRRRACGVEAGRDPRRSRLRGCGIASGDPRSSPPTYRTNSGILSYSSTHCISTPIAAKARYARSVAARASKA